MDKQNKYMKQCHFLVELNEQQRMELSQLEAFPFEGGVMVKEKLLLTGTHSTTLHNGMQSLQKKLQMSSPPVRVKTASPLPKSFYSTLTESMIDDDSVVEVYGYITREFLKIELRDIRMREKNKSTFTKLKQKGAVACFRDGDIPACQVVVAQNAIEMLNEMESGEEGLKLDLPRGEYVGFTNQKTGEEVKIFSFKSDEQSKERKRVGKMKDHSTCNKRHSLDETMAELDDVKKKHYYIYSSRPGYGKTLFITSTCRELNACQIRDLKNFTDVNPCAQFLLIDELDHKGNITFGQLKQLTSGDASSFAGNRKTFGKSFKARHDAQLIIMSNKHLFESVGSHYDPKTKRRTMTWHNAKQLYDRFHIFRLDENEIPEVLHGALCMSVEDGFYEADESAVVEDFRSDNWQLYHEFDYTLEKMLPDSMNYKEREKLKERYFNNLVRYFSWQEKQATTRERHCSSSSKKSCTTESDSEEEFQILPKKRRIVKDEVGISSSLQGYYYPCDNEDSDEESDQEAQF